MADGHLKIIQVPPGPAGLAAGIRELVRPESLVTSFHDPILAAMREVSDEIPGAELLSFGALVGRFTRMIGEPDVALVGDGHAQAMLARVAPLWAKDDVLRRAMDRPGTINVFLAQLREFRHWGTEAVDLRAAAQVLGESLGRRLEFLADIQDAVESEFDRQGRGFAATLVSRCLGSTFEGEVPHRHIVCLYGPHEFPRYEEWLKWVTRLGVRVDVVLDEPRPGQNLFESSGRVIDRLTSEQEVLPMESWAVNLFGEAQVASPVEVQILRAADQMIEAEWVVRSAIADIAAGVMPFQIGIYARQMDQYAPLLIAAADRLGLNLAASLPLPLLSTGFARLVLDLMSMIAGDDVRRLGRLATSTYLQVPYELRRPLEDELRIAYRQRDGQWQAALQFAERQQEEFPWLFPVLKWRAEHFDESLPLAKWTADFRDLIGGSGVVDLAATGTERSRGRDLRAQTVLQRSLSEKSAVLTDSATFRLGQFARLCDQIWREQSVYAPFGVDGVRLCQSAIGLEPFDVVYGLGMVEGAMPQRRIEGAVLSDSEKRLISEALRLPVPLPTSTEQARAERDEFVRLAAAGSRKVVFSHFEGNGESEQSRSFYLSDVERLLGDQVKHVVRFRSDLAPAADECRTAADRDLRSGLDGETVYPELPILKSELGRSVVRVRLNEGVSISEISHAVGCPFRGVARHRLNLPARAGSEGLRPLLDVPVRAAIASARDEELAQAMAKRALEDLLDEMYPRLAPWEVGLLRAAGERLVPEWVRREFAAREQFGLKPTATRIRPDVQDSVFRHPIKVLGQEVKLKGNVPAVTRTEHLSIITRYEQSDPLATNSPLSEERQATYGLLFLIQYTGPGTVGVQVDVSPSSHEPGKRTLHLMKMSAGTVLNGQVSQNLFVSRHDEREFFDQARKTILAGLRALEDGDIRTKPTEDRCSVCSYGELCRSSAIFGEFQDRPSSPKDGAS